MDFTITGPSTFSQLMIVWGSILLFEVRDIYFIINNQIELCSYTDTSIVHTSLEI